MTPVGFYRPSQKAAGGSPWANAKTASIPSRAEGSHALAGSAASWDGH